MKTVGERGATYTTSSLAPSRSCFPLETHLQSEGKTFQVAVAEYRSNLEGCKWLHCEALKGSEEGAGNRASGEVAGGHGGEGRLMTLVH